MISVAMASFNGEKNIERQISSVLENLNTDDELVISDDGSTDETLDIINGFCDRRIKVVIGPQKGLVKNFENAVRECNGEYIFLCDQDDYWYAGKVQKVLEGFEGNNYLLIEHDARVVDGNGEIIYPSFFQYRRVRRGTLKNLVRNTYHGCLMAFDSRIKPYIIPFPESGCFHDQWIGIVADYLGEVYFQNEILMDYVRHNENMSSFEHLPFTRQLSDRIKLSKNYIKRINDLKGKKDENSCVISASIPQNTGER